MIYKILFGYLALMSLAGFVSMGRDKHKAKAHLHRTPERRLFTYALLGGSAGSLLGMLVFRHKTKHLKFTVGIPLILIAQIIIAAAAVILF
jgi:uncharacterized membrane protein YsdA (DUF1294 family)